MKKSSQHGEGFTKAAFPTAPLSPFLPATVEDMITEGRDLKIPKVS